MKRLAIFALLAFLSTASGCDETPKSDRVEGGAAADTYADVTDVTIWRNIDDVPNVAVFCAGDHMFAATLSGDGTRDPALVFMQERGCGD